MAGYIDSVVHSVDAVNKDGEEINISKDDCGFSYRGSRFQNDHSFILTFVDLKLQRGDFLAIKEHLERIRKHRLETQPYGKSAGCFFKNPTGMSAGKLIEAAGCKGMMHGGAYVSEIHANFIINKENATADDLYELSRIVYERVKREYGIELEYEVRLVGEW